jgi:hypothetical protein
MVRGVLGGENVSKCEEWNEARRKQEELSKCMRVVTHDFEVHHDNQRNSALT